MSGKRFVMRLVFVWSTIWTIWWINSRLSLGVSLVGSTFFGENNFVAKILFPSYFSGRWTNQALYSPTLRRIIVLAYTIAKQKWPKNNENIFLKQFVFQLAPVIIVKQGCKQNSIHKLLVILFIRNSFKEYLHTSWNKTLGAFFVFGETVASFSMSGVAIVQG